MTCSRCRHEFCWQCLSPSRGFDHQCPGAPDVATFSPEQQHLIQQAVDNYDETAVDNYDETHIRRRAQELVEYAKAAAVSGGEAGAPAAGEAPQEQEQEQEQEQQQEQQRQRPIELPDVLEEGLEMGLLAAEIAADNMAAHTAAVAASPAAAASSTARAQAQQPIGGTALPAALNAVLELEALHHCRAMRVARRAASMEQRRDGHAARRMEEIYMEGMRREMRAMAWEMEEIEDEEMGDVRGMEEEVSGGEAGEMARLMARFRDERRAEMARFREDPVQRRERLALQRQVERLALQRRVASRYLAPTNAQVRYCAEKDSRPPCA